MMTRLRIGLLMVALACLAGCSAAISERDTLMKEKYAAYPDNIKKAIDGGTLVKGMTQEQVLLALGRTPCFDSRNIRGKVYDNWAYKLDKTTGKLVVPLKCFEAHNAVVFENGLLIEWDDK